ncbi:MAG: hypothetical protein WBC91_12705 [Phototrophicaceae bacterium]
MNELIDRYIHQVGLYVRPKERTEIEAELRSQIQDQLEDRYGESPTQANIVAVLKQLGDPHAMATSYGGEQYLIGPELYPLMMRVLSFGLPLVPVVVVIAGIIATLHSPEGGNWLGLLIGSIFTATFVALIFLAVVIIIFVILQQSDQELNTATTNEFNPLELPPVDDPATVNRFEFSVDIAIGTLVGIAILYYLQVGGLTLRFNLSNPGEVLPAPRFWLLVLMFTTFGIIYLKVWAHLRHRWTVRTWLMQTVLDLISAIGLYFALYVPILESLKQIIGVDVQLPFDQLPAIITFFTIVIMMLIDGTKLISLWQHQQGANA